MPKCVHVVCGEPPEIVGGEPVQSDKPVAGEVVEYKCQTGYTLADPSNLTCSANGNFTGEKPRCIKVKCKKLENIPFGQVWADGNEYGDAASYMCRPGYKVIGAMLSKCLANGSWSEEKPYCKEVVCQIPAPVENGYISSPGGFAYNKVIKISCNDGYNLRGSAERKCLADSKWSGEQPKCEEVACPKPIINHGFINESAGDQQIKDHVRNLDIFPFGITVNFGCEMGFQLWGNKELNCLENETWDGDVPTCERVKCPAPVISDSVITALHGYEYQRKIIVDCERGFKLSGESVLYCNADKTWSKSLPECFPVSCSPPTFVNGNFSEVKSPNRGTGYPYGLTLRFMCLPGYILVGEEISECSETATWVPDIPSCSQFTCPKPWISTYRANGLHIISPKEEYKYKETVEFTCGDGYRINGTATLVCAEKKLWSDAVPQCVRITCPEPTLENGDFSSYYTSFRPLTFNIGLNLFFRCYKGHRLVGSRNATCQADSTWSVALPSCVTVMCPPLMIDNSEVISTGNDNAYIYGVKVTVLCSEGFEMVGTSRLTCTNHGSWSAEPPYCKRIQCTKPNINNGMTEVLKQALSNRYVYNDVIRINCYEGFLLEGFSTLTCTITGQWSHDFPVCEPITCKRPNITNGRMSIIEIINPHSDPDQLHVFGTIVQFECHEGFRLIGQNDSVCSEQGIWVGGIPTCESVSCPDLNVTNSIINSTSTRYGSSVAFICDPGFQLFGDSALKCGANGKWQGLSPVCKPSPCPTLEITDGKIVGETSLLGIYVYGDRAIFLCNPGFILHGQNILLCQQNQTWSSEVPVCKRRLCSKAPYEFEHGSISVHSHDGQNNSFNATLTFECDLGFKIVGKPSIQCNVYGLWTTSFPQCQRVFCSSPYLVNGAIKGKPLIGGNYTFGDSIVFTCNPGFFRQGDGELLCQPDGRWTSSFPDCLRQSCENPQNPENGYFTGTSYFFESRISFYCYQGYELEGPSFSTCLASGKWDVFPLCKLIKCNMPPGVDNGELSVNGIQYQDIAEYSCKNGFVLYGQKTAVCQANGTWSGKPPRCQKQECTEWPIIKNGTLSRIQENYVYGDVAYIVCDKGHKVEGDASVRCQEGGTWGTILSKCVIVKCSYPKRILNGRVSYMSVTYDSVITYTCDKGYTLVGKAERRCEATGFWSDLQPSCHIVRCPEPKRALFKNGYIVGSAYMYNSIVTYKCSVGYVLQGESRHQCLSTGEWNSTLPRCIPVDCGQPLEIANALIQVSSTVYRAVAEYQCNRGYNIRGAVFHTCSLNGRWSGQLTSCEKVTCPVPVDIDNGFYEGENFTFMAEIKYQCKEKYALEGDSIQSCDESGRWSGTTPQCRAKKCPPPDRSASDHLLMSGDDFSAGSILSFQCDTGYRLIGEEKVTCEDGAHWSGNLPRCEEISCGVPRLIKNGFIDGNSYQYQDIVQIGCVAGYTVQGESTIECQANGKWSDINATCIPVTCGKPPDIEHATIGGSSFNFGEYIFYKCLEGFEMTGNNLLQCSSNGTWEGTLPSCHMTSCGSVPVIPHASTIVTKTTYGSKASYKCNRGYNILGSAMVECIANGTWSYQDKPKCVPLDCGIPQPLPHGNIKYAGTTLGEYAEYFCDEGYLMVGKPVIRCLPEDGWNSSAPQCLPVSCPTPVDPENGSVDGNSFEFGNQILYSCSQGFKLIGEAIRTCEGNGKWSSRQPRCDGKTSGV